MANPAYVKDNAGNWQEIATATTDLSNYANLTNTPVSGFRNAIINGGMDIWQRGTSITLTSGAYTADRWMVATDKTASSVVTSRQSFTPGNVISGYEPAYFLRNVVPSGGTYQVVQQRVEDVRTFAGQTVTLSYWAKADSAVTNQVLIEQNFGTGGSAAAGTSTVNHSLTTSWARYTATFTMPSISGKTIGANSFLDVRVIRTIDALAHTIDIWGVQLERGNIATPFEQRPVGTELALCQRYYQRINQTDYESLFGMGSQTTTTNANFIVYLPTQLRTIPSSVVFSNVKIGDQTAWSTAATLNTFNRSTVNALSLTTTMAANGAAYRPAYLQGASSAPYNAYIEISAEL